LRPTFDRRIKFEFHILAMGPALSGKCRKIIDILSSIAKFDISAPTQLVDSFDDVGLLLQDFWRAATTAQMRQSVDPNGACEA
jgi:hypothetical protein